MIEISEDRIWVLASNKHKYNGMLQFWGHLTANDAERSYGDYFVDFSKCERYSTADKEKGNYYDFPTLDSNSSYFLELTKTEHYWIKVDELEKCKFYRKKTVFMEG